MSIEIGERRYAVMPAVGVALGGATAVVGGVGIAKGRQTSLQTRRDLPDLKRAAADAKRQANRHGSAADAQRGAQGLVGEPVIRAYADEGSSRSVAVKRVDTHVYGSVDDALEASKALSPKLATAVYSLDGHHVPMVLDDPLKMFRYDTTVFKAGLAPDGKGGTTVTSVPVTEQRIGTFVGFDGHPNVRAAATGIGDELAHYGRIADADLARATKLIARAPLKMVGLGALAAAGVAAAGALLPTVDDGPAWKRY
jgi:hypothetical protein